MVDTHKELKDLLINSSSEGVLTWAQQADLAERSMLSPAEIEAQAFDLGIVPLRYKRNFDAITLSEQVLLFNSRITVVGCGGLGGYILQELARLGVGTVCAWDGDSFEEHNLNRQALAYIDGIGQSKVKAAAQIIKVINPAVEFIGFNRRFVGEVDEEYLIGTDVVIDALDNVSNRLLLARVCRKLNIPLIHGAVNGWYGQLCTQFPEDTTIEQIYEHYSLDQTKTSASTVLGFVPAALASLQVAEAVKVLLGRGKLLRGKLMIINMLDMDVDILEIKPGKYQL